MLQIECISQGHLGLLRSVSLQQVLLLWPAFLSCALQQHPAVNGSQLLPPGYLFLQVALSRALENQQW